MCILTPVLFGYGNFLQLIFANKLANILSKFTFNVYLVHLIVYLYKVGITRESMYFSHEDMRIKTLNNTVVSFLLAFLLTVTVEFSFMNIEKRFLTKQTKLQ